MSAMHLLERMEMRLAVELGATTMTLREALNLGPGDTVALDRATDEPLDLTVNGERVARGEVVAENGRFALRILEVAAGPAPAGEEAP